MIDVTRWLVVVRLEGLLLLIELHLLGQVLLRLAMSLHLTSATQTAAVGLHVAALSSLRASTRKCARVDGSTLGGRPGLTEAIGEAGQFLAKLEHAFAALVTALALLLQLSIDLHLLRLQNKLIRILTIVLSQGLLELLLNLALVLRVATGRSRIDNEAVVVDVDVLHREVQIVILHCLDVQNLSIFTVGTAPIFFAVLLRIFEFWDESQRAARVVLLTGLAAGNVGKVLAQLKRISRMASTVSS